MSDPKAVGIFGLIRQTATDWMDDGALRLERRALAYYSIFSIPPLLVIAISMAGFFSARRRCADKSRSN